MKLGRRRGTINYDRGTINYDEAAAALIQAMPRFVADSDWDPNSGPGPLFDQFADHVADLARTGEDEAMVRHCLGLVERFAVDGSRRVQERLVHRRVLSRLASDQQAFALCRLHMGPGTLVLAQAFER